MTRLLVDMFILLAFAALLWVFHLYSRLLTDLVLLSIWLSFTLIITSGLVWRGRLRRRSFLAVYIAAESSLQQLLRGGLLMILSKLLLAMILAMLLIIVLIRSAQPSVWIVLIMVAPLLVLLRTGVQDVFKAHVSPIYRSEFSLRISLPLMGIPLIALLIYLSMYRSYPDFTAISLERAVWHMVEQEQARSETLLTGLQIAAASDALRLWLAQQLLPMLGVPLFQWLGWLLIFVRETVFVWSYLLLCQGVLLGVNRHVRS
jgi:hypothetical protein